MPVPRRILGRASAFFVLLVTFADAHRFLSQNTASQFLRRHRRANSVFEETKAGNLERECIEELCNKEEAREIFENQPETEYFYPKYVVCLGSHRVGISNGNSGSDIPSNLRTCVKEISNQCTPFPCYKEGSEGCVDGQASFTCVCKPGWKGRLCEYDIDECSDPDFPAGCKHKCNNIPGSFYCMCDEGYFLNDKTNCVDVNECERVLCDGTCVNTVGSYTCICDGRAGLRLAADERYCETIPICVDLNDYKHPEMLYLGELFAGRPVILLHFRLPENTKFAAEFDFRTFDPEGVILYAESSNHSWFMLGLRGGRIEVQFKNHHAFKVTSGGKFINDGEWHVISVDELENSISVKISNEAVMSINSPESLFTSVNGKLETKVYIAGLPNRTNNIIKPINPRLDGCIRGWNFMKQGPSGVKEIIKGKQSKHCFVHVERGSFFSGEGLAHFDIDYSKSGKWNVNVEMQIRPSKSTGVLFALVYNNTVPLSVAVVEKGEGDANLQVFLEGVSVATLDSLMLCYPERLGIQLNVTPSEIQLSASSSTVSYIKSDVLEKKLEVLNITMQNPVSTYIGGIPGNIPLIATPVSAFYYGCMEITINDQWLDFDEAHRKHNSIKSHSCPPVSASESHPIVSHLHR
uniref:Vitamin K-dependent protein S n=1 Tax=Oryzias sinensis TaxID=183150 RepID=A0A8C7YWA7_9TELE